MASSGSYSTNRGRIPGFRTTSLRPWATSVVPKTGVTSDPEYVVGIAATNQRESPAVVSPVKRATAAFAVPIGLPPPRPTSTSAFSECASFATCSAVSTGTCGRVPENIPTMIGPSALRTVCPTRPKARLEPVTTYARLRPSRPSWGASSSTHPGASTINVSPSWRVTRGRSTLEVPLIARPGDRYDLGGPEDALGLALPNYGVDSDEEGHHGDGERRVAHRRESVQCVGRRWLDDHRADHPGPRSTDVIGVDLAEVCERPRGGEGVREGGAGNNRHDRRRTGRVEVRARIPRGGASRNGSRDRVRLGRICEPPIDGRSLNNGQVLRGEGLHRVHRVSPPGGRSDGHRRKPGGDRQIAGHSRMDLAEVAVRSRGQSARIEFEHGTWREEFPRSHVGQCPGRGEGRTRVVGEAAVRQRPGGGHRVQASGQLPCNGVTDGDHDRSGGVAIEPDDPSRCKGGSHRHAPDFDVVGRCGETPRGGEDENYEDCDGHNCNEPQHMNAVSPHKPHHFRRHRTSTLKPEREDRSRSTPSRSVMPLVPCPGVDRDVSKGQIECARYDVA